MNWFGLGIVGIVGIPGRPPNEGRPN